MNRNARSIARTAAALAATVGVITGVTACAESDSSGSVTISYGYWDTSMTDAFAQAAEAFEDDNPGITIELQQVPFDSYFTKLNTQLQGNSAPDVFWLQNIQFPLYSENDQLADLTDYVADDAASFEGIPASTMDTYVYDGKRYAVPWQVISFGLYYNKKMFADAGVAAPTNDWTWDDVAAAAAGLTDPATGTYGIVAPLWNYGNFYQTMYAFGAKIITDNGTDTDFDSPAAIKGLDFWADIVRKGYSPTLAQIADTNQDQWFQSGQVAMESTGSWNAAIFAGSLGEDLGIVEMPAGTVDTSGAATTANAVAKNSSHVAEAYKWVSYLASPEGQTLLNTAAGASAGAPANASANEAWLKSAGTPDARVFLDEIARTTPLPATRNTAAWENELTETLAPAWNGEASTEAVAKAMAEKIREALRKEQQ